MNTSRFEPTATFPLDDFGAGIDRLLGLVGDGALLGGESIDHLSSNFGRITTRIGRLLVLAVMAAMLTGCEKYALDQQMEELCKKDGGTKVYEAVRAPIDAFDAQGHKRLNYAEAQSNRENLLGPEYRYVERFEFVSGTSGNEWKGHLDRYVTQVIRRADGKLLGESIAYSRVGGDGITSIIHWQPSSRTCPHPHPDLVNAVFVREE